MQSKLGRELNRIMMETGASPLQMMSAYMTASALNIGNHKFVSAEKPLPPPPEADKVNIPKGEKE